MVGIMLMPFCDAALKFALIPQFFGDISTFQTLSQHKLAIYTLRYIGSFNHSCVIMDLSLSIPALFANIGGTVVI